MSSLAVARQPAVHGKKVTSNGLLQTSNQYLEYRNKLQRQGQFFFVVISYDRFIAPYQNFQ